MRRINCQPKCKNILIENEFSTRSFRFFSFTSLFPDNPLMYTLSTIFSVVLFLASFSNRSKKIGKNNFGINLISRFFAKTNGIASLYDLERTKMKKIEWIRFDGVFVFSSRLKLAVYALAHTVASNGWHFLAIAIGFFFCYGIVCIWRNLFDFKVRFRCHKPRHSFAIFSNERRNVNSWQRESINFMELIN